MPEAAELQDALQIDGQHTFTVAGTIASDVAGEDGAFAEIQGDATVLGAGPDLSADVSGVRCNRCASSADCTHLEAVEREIIERATPYVPTARTRRAAADILDAVTDAHAQSEAAQATARDTWPNPEVSYEADFAAFQDAYLAARDGDSDRPVPFMTEDATAGLGARDGGRGFGVELEYDFDSSIDDRAAATAAIARDLRAAGLTRQRHQAGYHAAARRGYSDDPSGWSLETDATVGGELVSPILYDDPRSWRALATACDIIKRHGGKATLNTGGHVHVSVNDYDHTVANHNRLLRMFDAYQDTIYRLAANPFRGTHRGVAFCWPNQNPATGYRTISAARDRNYGHGTGLNLQAVWGHQSDHAEFRMWDGSLDPGTIQTQIKLSLGITEAAFRDANSTTTLPAAEPVGVHYRANPNRHRLTGQSWRANTASFRQLIDTVFWRSSDKAQATALFAATRWSAL